MELLDSWVRSLKAGNRSPATIDAYVRDIGHLLHHLGDTDVTAATRRHVEAFLAERTRVDGRPGTLADATIARRYRTLVQFFGWLDDESELAGANPMTKMRPPKVAEQPPPIISSDEMAKLLAACRGVQVGKATRHRARKDAPSRGRESEYECRRDEAIVLLLATTGVRAGEIMGLTLDDVDIASETIVVRGKGNKLRIVVLVPQVVEALDRYMRARRRHTFKVLPDLWLGERGRLTDSGLRQVLERRCEDAGIDAINPHRFRHTFAHRAKQRGMGDGDLMAIAGWSSPQMLHRYGASAAAERARDAHRRLFGEDRL